MMRSLTIALLAVSLIACSKKEDNKAATAGNTTGGVTISNVDDYTAKRIEMAAKVNAVFAGADKDCDKLASSLSKVFDDLRATSDAVEAFEIANQGLVSTVDEKLKAEERKHDEVMFSALAPCGEHKGVMAAFDKLKR